jgi:signal transduction histidine kinase/DNA-binding response OmpR family regulator
MRLNMKSIQVKVFAVLLAGLALAFGALIGLQTFAEYDHVVRITREANRNQTALIAAQSRIGIEAGDEELIENVFFDLVYDDHNHAGEPVAHSEIVKLHAFSADGARLKSFERLDAPEIPDEVLRALAHQSGQSGNVEERKFDALTIIAAPVSDEFRESVIGAVVIAWDTQSIIAQIESETLLHAGAGGLAAILTILGTLLAVRMIITRPLTELARQVADIRETGEVAGESALCTRKDEIGSLSQCFNSVFGELIRRNSELQSAVDAADDANKAKSLFLASMSHELRTPLNAIIGYSEMMLEDAELDGNNENVDDLRKIRGAGKHLLALISDVLDLSKIEAGSMELDPERFAVLPFVEEVVETCRSLARKNENQLTVSFGDGVDTMVGDQTKLRQCLLNLLSNACKFTKEGRITVRVDSVTTPEGDWLRFAVSDTGIGISPKDLPKLFSNFAQASSATSTKYGGTGLGLALTQKLCDLMGGRITVESAPGEGACFTIHVPTQARASGAGEPMDEADELEREVLPHEAQFGSRPVLVIDDDPAARDLLQRMLSKAGFSPLCAETAERGLELARQTKPEVIILDVELPREDGWYVLRMLKDDPDLKDCPVVMLTIVDDRRTATALGASDYLVKPIDRDGLLAAVGRLLPEDHQGYVLVVDDDPDMSELIARTLRREGWAVETAANGAEAIAFVEKAAPKLVLLDLSMPVLDGFEFAERLRSNGDWDDVPVVVLTGKDVTSSDKQRLEGVTILAKRNFDPENILGEVRKLARDAAPAKTVREKFVA